MKSYSILIAASLLCSCAADPSLITSEKQAIDQVVAPFEQGAIILDVQTDPDLNALYGHANSCALLVIQAEKASAINKLLSNPVALKSLFSAAGAQDDILKVDRYAAMPGQSTTLHIDRSEGSRYVAIVAGYYPFPQKRHMALVEIPVVTQKTGWWSPVWQAKLASLSLKIRLGSNSIHQLEGATLHPVTLTRSDIVPASATEKGN